MRLVSLLAAALLFPASALACGDYMSFRSTEQKVAMMRGEGWRAQMASWSVANDETVDAPIRSEAFLLIGVAQWKSDQHDAALESFRKAKELDDYALFNLYTLLPHADVKRIQKSVA